MGGVSSLDKLIKKLENNPKNASFDDIKRLLLNHGYELDHVRGSHHINLKRWRHDSCTIS